jgi:tetratricopeptide (TPR) repeat protein/tRNA A-37 threonylcarbamoyl transferase component Bud32
MSDASPSPRIPGLRDSVPGAAYKRGDVIGGKYEVRGVLGKGGFGIVYLVYLPETESVYALKTFRDEYLADAEVTERFRKEASIWVDLERHPYLVRAYFVDEIASRLYVGMEFIAPDAQGLNSLEGHLQRRSLDLAQSLRWAIQFCHGMEYAYSKGIRCHRDIKPANMMIASDKTVRISDFGLAGVVGMSKAAARTKLDAQQMTVGLSGQTVEGTAMGTPEYMPPEQFTDAQSCDERSDVYSLGVVLYQMVADGRLPYTAPARTFSAWYKAHSESATPELHSPMSPIVARCLEKDPGRRYPGFRELRAELEPMLRRQTGEAIAPPVATVLQAWEWTNKGGSLLALDRPEDAVRCFDRALLLDPQNVHALCNKGTALKGLLRPAEALRCYDMALDIEPTFALALSGKGNLLNSVGRYEEAIRFLDKALELDSLLGTAWGAKGLSLMSMGQYDMGLGCFNRALELDPCDLHSLFSKGLALQALRRHAEAVACCDGVIRLEPDNARAWCQKAVNLQDLGQREEALRCYSRALECDPNLGEAWCGKGVTEEELGRNPEAVASYQSVLKLADDGAADLASYARQRLQHLAHASPPVSDSIRAAAEQVKTAEAKFGRKGPYVAALTRLAEAYRAEGLIKEAEDIYTSAIELTEKALGPRTIFLPPLLNNLAQIMLETGRRDRAEALYNRAVSLIEGYPGYGPEDQNLGPILTNLGALYDGGGRHQEAQKLYERALDIKEKALGRNHVSVAVTLEHYAASLRASGDVALAQKHEERARRIRTSRT